MLLVNRGSRFQGFTPEGERVLDWARRIVGDTRAMRQEINALQARPHRPAAHRRDPDRARHGGSAHHAVSRAPSGCALHHPVAHLDRDPDAPGKSRDRRRPDLSRQRAARPRDHRCRSISERYRLLTSPPTRRSATATASPGRRSRRCRSACSRRTCRTAASSTRLLRERRRRSADRRWNPNSMIVLFAHVRTGRWASVMPASLPRRSA